MRLRLENCNLKIKSIDIGREEALRLYETEFWKDWSARDIAAFQMYNDRLLMPFEVFQSAMEWACKRPVWSHEFAFTDRLREELEGIRGKPAFREIVELVL